LTNKEIAKTFQFLGDIMELHGENPFKIRSYQNAYLTLRKLDQPLTELEDKAIAAIKGIGAAISAKIRELLNTGKMSTLEEYRSKTPVGVQEMLHIKGFGPKKIRVIWQELDIETIGELLYAVNENRLLELKGFGKKTQDELRQQLEYYLKSRNQFHYAALEKEALQLVAALQKALPQARIELTGAIRRKANVLSQIELLVASADELEPVLAKIGIQAQKSDSGSIQALSANELPVTIYLCEATEFGSKQFRFTAAPEFLQAFLAKNPGQDFRDLAQESDIFAQVQLPFLEPELRESAFSLDLALAGKKPILIEAADIKGVIHSHSTYSDGLHSLRDMATYTRSQGFEYLVITDHSKAAFYANGLQPERVWQQMSEIDALNQELAPFRIFKGIESDILNDGSLDYEPDVLAAFDLIIASVHTNLRMDQEKATARLIKAIENPYTTILGHPTGRLLLSREGYPIDHRKVIDACVSNGVVIELNASPYRLDLDWTWIPYVLERGGMIAINPDAHSQEGIHDIHFGVASARKGGLSSAQCLNTLGLNAFDTWIKQRKTRGLTSH
jgi:DNA polymerase (family 10)